jgi:hypothetical protein
MSKFFTFLTGIFENLENNVMHYTVCSGKKGKSGNIGLYPGNSGEK